MFGVGPNSSIAFPGRSMSCTLSSSSLLQDVRIHYRIPQTVTMGSMMQHILSFSSYLPTFVLLSPHLTSCIDQICTLINTYQLSDSSFQPQFIYHFIFFSLLDYRYGRSSFIMTLYCRLGSGMFCRNLYFFVQVQSRRVELSWKFVATLILNKECSKLTSTIFKVSFFLVLLFYSYSFGLINSIKGIGNSTIIGLTFFREFDVKSTCF